MKDKIRDIAENKELKELSEEDKEMEKVSGGLYVRPITKLASSCTCSSKCGGNQTNSDASAGLSGDA
jgi:hypothetical protein